MIVIFTEGSAVSKGHSLPLVIISQLDESACSTPLKFPVVGDVSTPAADATLEQFTCQARQVQDSVSVEPQGVGVGCLVGAGLV